jgi:hypothetical protein
MSSKKAAWLAACKQWQTSVSGNPIAVRFATISDVANLSVAAVAASSAATSGDGVSAAAVSSASGGGASAAAAGAVSLKAGGGFDSVGTEATGVAGVGGAAVQLLGRSTSENQLGCVGSCQFDNGAERFIKCLAVNLEDVDGPAPIDRPIGGRQPRQNLS